MGQFPKILWTENMFKLYLLVVSAVAVLSAPLEDTADVVAAKAEFQAAFDMAVEGRLGELAPVNNDVQAEQIAAAYMADTEDVAAAKAQFMAAFEDAEAAAPMVEETSSEALDLSPITKRGFLILRRNVG